MTLLHITVMLLHVTKVFPTFLPSFLPSHFPTFPLSHFPLSYFPPFPLSHFPTFPLSHFPTFSLRHLPCRCIFEINQKRTAVFMLINQPAANLLAKNGNHFQTQRIGIFNI